MLNTNTDIYNKKQYLDKVIIMGKKVKAPQPRTANKAHFVRKFEDEEFLNAVKKCMEESTCTAGEVAEIVGCNSTVAKNRLLQLADQGKLNKKIRGRTWGFRP